MIGINVQYLLSKVRKILMIQNIVKVLVSEKQAKYLRNDYIRFGFYQQKFYCVLPTPKEVSLRQLNGLMVHRTN